MNGSTKILIAVATTQELEAGAMLRRFKAEVSKDEPRRGNNTNRHARSTSAVYLEIVTICGILLTRVLVFSFFQWYVCVCAVFSCDFCICVENKVTGFAC